jgi:hypothetical protein
MRIGSSLVAALLCVLQLPPGHSTRSGHVDPDPQEGPAVVVGHLSGRAPGSIVWEVLTDYDHMAQFLSNIEYSSVEDTAGNVLRVHQKGKASRAA